MSLGGPLSDLYAKYFVIQGALAGGAVSYILGEGPWQRRVAVSFGGALASYVLTPGAIDIGGSWIPHTPGTEGLFGFVFGVTGMILSQALINAAKRVRTRAPDVADRAIDRFQKERTSDEHNQPSD